MSIFNDSERELIDATRFVLRDGVERLKSRSVLFPSTKGKAAREECREAREALTMHLIAEFGALRYETAAVALIDAQGRLIAVETFNEGERTHCEIKPRQLAEKIIRTGAAAVVLAHNHPSGDCTPSKQDVMMTADMLEWLKPLDCVLLDHLVLSSGDVSCIMGEWND